MVFIGACFVNLTLKLKTSFARSSLCYCKKEKHIDRLYFFMDYTFVDWKWRHEMLKTWQWNNSLAARCSTWILNILWSIKEWRKELQELQVLLELQNLRNWTRTTRKEKIAYSWRLSELVRRSVFVTILNTLRVTEEIYYIHVGSHNKPLLLFPFPLIMLLLLIGQV